MSAEQLTMEKLTRVLVGIALFMALADFLVPNIPYKSAIERLNDAVSNYDTKLNSGAFKLNWRWMLK